MDITVRNRDVGGRDGIYAVRIARCPRGHDLHAPGRKSIGIPDVDVIPRRVAESDPVQREVLDVAQYDETRHLLISVQHLALVRQLPPRGASAHDPVPAPAVDRSVAHDTAVADVLPEQEGLASLAMRVGKDPAASRRHVIDSGIAGRGQYRVGIHNQGDARTQRQWTAQKYTLVAVGPELDRLSGDAVIHGVLYTIGIEMPLRCRRQHIVRSGNSGTQHDTGWRNGRLHDLPHVLRVCRRHAAEGDGDEDRNQADGSQGTTLVKSAGSERPAEPSAAAGTSWAWSAAPCRFVIRSEPIGPLRQAISEIDGGLGGLVFGKAMLGDEPRQKSAVDPACDVVARRNREERARVVVEADRVVEARGLRRQLAEAAQPLGTVVKPPGGTQFEHPV